MPKTSDKAILLNEVEEAITFLLLIEDDTADENSVMVDTEERFLDELFLMHEALSETRYFMPRRYVKNKPSMAQFLFGLTDRQFRQEARMHRNAFTRIVDILKVHPVFQNHSRLEQTPVWIQCLVAFKRFGSYGNANSLGNNGRNLGFSEGAVVKFMHRVITALLSIRDQVIKWPDAEERSRISERFKKNYGLGGSVGIIDGTPVVLSQRPAIDGETFFSRKGVYCINLQLVCDDEGYIRYYITGWPGSVYDNTVFSKSRLYQQPENHFSPDQFLLADSGYALTHNCMVPYRQPYASEPLNQKYNELFSSARVKIELLNGSIKTRFGSLKGIPTQVKSKDDFKRVNRHIVATLVLHNVLLRFDDKEWTEEDGRVDEIPHNQDLARDALQANAAANLEGEEGPKNRRLILQNQCLAWYLMRNPHLSNILNRER